jgi:hypothetical protein
MCPTLGRWEIGSVRMVLPYVPLYPECSARSLALGRLCTMNRWMDLHFVGAFSFLAALWGSFRFTCHLVGDKIHMPISWLLDLSLSQPGKASLEERVASCENMEGRIFYSSINWKCAEWSGISLKIVAICCLKCCSLRYEEPDGM